MLLPRVAVLGLLLATVGCMPPVMPADKLTDSAYSVVEAARFGRMDIVISAVKPADQAAYAESHADWGGIIRILDIEYGGAKLTGGDKAVVMMTVAWQRLDESMLRSTSLKQTWQLASEQRWVIVKEEIAGGDAGLIKEPELDVDGKPLAAPPKKVAASDPLR